jgi:adenosine deaminase CECR1
MFEGMKKHSDLIVGYDMVNEEDYVIPLKELLPMIFEASNGQPFPMIFHAGESVDVNNENLYDAILLGTKRIGHGFNLALHPHLQ